MNFNNSFKKYLSLKKMVLAKWMNFGYNWMNFGAKSWPTN